MNTMYDIEKNIPIPAYKKANRFPYMELDIGDSFLVTDVSLNSVCGSNYRVGKRLNRKFTARQEGSGVRVWRVS